MKRPAPPFAWFLGVFGQINQIMTYCTDRPDHITNVRPFKITQKRPFRSLPQRKDGHSVSPIDRPRAPRRRRGAIALPQRRAHHPRDTHTHAWVCGKVFGSRAPRCCCLVEGRPLAPGIDVAFIGHNLFLLPTFAGRRLKLATVEIYQRVEIPSGLIPAFRALDDTILRQWRRPTAREVRF